MTNSKKNQMLKSIINLMNSIINRKQTLLEKEYFLIKSLIAQIDLKFKLENETIIQTIKELENEVPLYVKDITNLNDEIKNLRIELQVKSPNIQVENLVDEILPSPIEENDTLDIKKMYRMISSKCHPDKTDNKELHNLFITATGAYHSHNYSVILEIYNSLSQDNLHFQFSDISIEQKLEIVKKEYQKRKEEYDKLLTTNGYVITNLIKTNKKTYARKAFLDLLFKQIIDLETLRSQLKNNLSKKS